MKILLHSVARKENCQNTEICRTFEPSNAHNCVNQCISATCYAEVYAADPLEDGEIDKKRDIMFIKCIRIEEKGKKTTKAT